MKTGIILEIQNKLEAATGSMRQICEIVIEQQATNPDSYAERAARTGTDHQRADKDIPNYLSMAKKASSQRPGASKTNSTLARVYVQDWRKDPVGTVKRALRLAIGEWLKQDDMGDTDEQDTSPTPELDAVRHLNQFGTPDAPLMEVACTVEKRDQVIQFFEANKVQYGQRI